MGLPKNRGRRLSFKHRVWFVLVCFGRPWRRCGECTVRSKRRLIEDPDCASLFAFTLVGRKTSAANFHSNYLQSPLPVQRMVSHKPNFIEKLVKILEESDPTVVRWGTEGTSFLVLDVPRCVSGVQAPHRISSVLLVGHLHCWCVFESFLARPAPAFASGCYVVH